MSDPVGNAALKLNLLDREVIDLAASNYGLLKTRNANLVLKDIWVNVPYVVLSVTSTKLNRDFDQNVAAKLAGMNLRAFKNAINKVNTLIDQQQSQFTPTRSRSSGTPLTPSIPKTYDWKSEVNRLCIRTGSQMLLSDCSYLIQKLQDESKKEINSQIVAALFFCCAKSIKMTIKLEEVWDGDAKQFKSMIEKLKAFFQEELEEISSNHKLKFRKRKPVASDETASSSGKENTNVDGAPEQSSFDLQNISVKAIEQLKENTLLKKERLEFQSNGMNSMVPSKDIKMTRAYRNYILWKDNLTKKLKEELATLPMDES